MTSKLLFIVEDAFDVSNRGVVLSPGHLLFVDPLEDGDLIRLIRPDGIEIIGEIRGKEFPSYSSDYPPEKQRAGVLIANLPIEDVPIGTEVWSI